MQMPPRWCIAWRRTDHGTGDMGELDVGRHVWSEMRWVGPPRYDAIRSRPKKELTGAPPSEMCLPQQ
jgi:hypothetical protein